MQIYVEVPRKLTKKQRELLNALAETEQTSISPERKGFFDKLKEYFAPEGK